MEYFAQQLINGLALGSIYGLIAIGYTMVYGIIGMINFAHGDIFMIGAFIALITFLMLVSFGITAVPADPADRAAGRRWRSPRSMAGRSSASPTGRCAHSFRLAPLISAIGMSIVLQNYVAGGAGRARQAGAADASPAATRCIEGATASSCSSPTSRSSSSSPRSCCWRCSPGWSRARGSAATCAPASRTGRWPSLLGVDVDRTISLTFVIGAALAAVAGMMYLLYYGVIDFFIGFVAGIKAFTAAVLGGIGSLPGAMLGGLLIGLIETLLVGLLLGRVQGRRRVLDPDRGADLPADRPARPARSREGLTGASVSAPPPPCTASRASGAAFIAQGALISALVALGAVLR